MLVNSIFALCALASHQPADTPADHARPLPFAFVENRGQWHPAARFRARTGPTEAWILDDGIRLHADGAVVDLRFVAAHDTARPRGRDVVPVSYSWLRGGDPARSVSAARGFRQLCFADLYDGIDVILREHGGHLEYDLALDAGADLARVRVRCDGIEAMGIAADGSLQLETAAGTLTQKPPLTFAIDARGGRREVRCRYVIVAEDVFGFAVDRRDAGEALLVDPGLVWSTYVGGSGRDVLHAVDVAPSGATVVAGWTESSDLPTTPGAWQETYAGNPVGRGTGDAFVAMLAADGGSYTWVTYLGGTSGDEALAVDIDPTGAVTVAGTTLSRDFPTTADAFDRGNAGDRDLFVARLDATGSTLSYSTFFGGVRDEEFGDVTYDATNGIVHLSGRTTSRASSDRFPVTADAFQTENNRSNAFLSILDLRQTPGATVLAYSTFLGGVGTHDHAGRHHVDASGVVTLSGITTATDHPTTPGAFQTSRQGFRCGFVTRIDPSQAGASGLIYSTYLGGTSDELAVHAATDSAGFVTAAGATRSTSFPVTANALQGAHRGQADAFVCRLDPSQSGAAQLTYSTFLGGDVDSSDERVHALRIADGGIAIVGGSANADVFPITPGAFQRARRKGGGHTHGFSSLFDLTASGSQSLIYSTVIESCGQSDDAVRDVHYDHATRTATLVGVADADFPTSPNAPQRDLAGGGADGFVMRLELRPLPPAVVAFGTACPGTTGTPALEPLLDPQLCLRYRILATGLPPNQPVVFYFGFSRTLWNGFQLPLDLGFLGMGTCQLYVSPDIPVFTTTGSGTRSYGFAIPFDRPLVGLRFHNQAFFLDPGANTIGVVGTNAVEAEVRY